MNNYTKRNIWKLLVLAFLLLLIIEINAVTSLFDLPKALFHPTSSSTLKAGLISVLGILFLFIFTRLIISAGNFISGAKGEEHVGERLRKLSPQYIVLENIILDPAHGNIDFVVVGPKGVAVAEVKSHKGFITFRDGKLLKNGRSFEKNFLWQVESQAKELEKTIRTGLNKFVPVNPFLVFSSRFVRLKFGMNPLAGTRIVVVKIDWINNCVLDQKGTYLSDSEVKRIVDFLKKYQQD